MTPAAELWAAVVKHCATGMGYRIAVQSHRLTLDSGGAQVYVEPRDGGWIVVDGWVVVASRCDADEAVRAALEIVAPEASGV